MHAHNRHPARAVEIALELLRHRDILRLRSARLVADVVTASRVSHRIARAAVALARKAAPEIGPVGSVDP